MHFHSIVQRTFILFSFGNYPPWGQHSSTFACLYLNSLPSFYPRAPAQASSPLIGPWFSLLPGLLPPVSPLHSIPLLSGESPSSLAGVQGSFVSNPQHHHLFHHPPLVPITKLQHPTVAFAEIVPSAQNIFCC